MRPTIVLFDIDGTLLTTDGAGRRALAEAFAAVAGRPDVVDRIDFAGATDPSIVCQGLGAAGMADDEETVARIFSAYLPALERELARPGAIMVHPGVAALVARLRQQPDVAVGLGTGNIEPGARAKVGRAGLAEAFAFGGFGSDHHDRPTLLETGARRGAARLGRAREACDVVVIGDTPRDLAAASAIGASCVLVGTGVFSTGALRRAGGTVVVDTLESDQVIGVVMGESS